MSDHDKKSHDSEKKNKNESDGDGTVTLVVIGLMFFIALVGVVMTQMR
jgi:hypothetical protein